MTKNSTDELRCFVPRTTRKSGLLSRSLVLLLIFGSAAIARAVWAEQALAIVGEATITDTQVESAINSAPFGTAFPAMDEDVQAALRGDMLIRLVDAALLRLEAQREGLDKRTDFVDELARYREGMLYRRYLDSLRDSLTIPRAVERKLKEKYEAVPDALAAARASYLAGLFKGRKQRTFDDLKRRYKYRIYPDRMAGAVDGTILADGEGISIRYGEIRDRSGPAQAESGEKTAQAVEDLAELRLGALAATAQGIDVRREVEDYKQLLLSKALLDTKEREWIPGESAVADFFHKHPELGQVPELRHVGQIVLATRKEAQAVRNRILRGESLFELAGQLSIDPVGRRQAGDMGWLAGGTGFPRIEAALSKLKDNEVSEVIETPKGFHLVMIIDRKPGSQKSLAQIEDRVRQALISEKQTEYFRSLRQKYPVQWLVPVHGQ